MKRELRRQGIHVVFSLAMIGFWLLVDRWVFVSSLVAAIGLAAAAIRSDSRLSNRVLDILERDAHRQTFPGKGGFLLAAGITLTAILLPSQFIPAVLVLAISDSLSTIVGKWVGTDRLHARTKKTWAGVAAFFISAAVILFFFTMHWFVVAILVTALEAADYTDVLVLDDNLIVPVATGALLLLL